MKKMIKKRIQIRNSLKREACNKEMSDKSKNQLIQKNKTKLKETFDDSSSIM